MQRLGLILFSIICFTTAQAQLVRPSKISPDAMSFENIYVKTLHTDSLQSTFLIWIRNKVNPHYHNYHTEYIQVVSGSGIMSLGDSTFAIKEGDAVIIPKGTIHSVITDSKTPLKVVSVQAPKFDGDRIWVTPKNE